MENKPKDFTEVDKLHYAMMIVALCECIKALNDDVVTNCDFAPKLTSRPAFLRLIELKDKLTKDFMLV